MKGWVYVITNPAMPGLLKIGYSTKDPELRAQELNHTGAPHPYVVDYDLLVDDPYWVEQRAHIELGHAREGKEWFRCSHDEAIGAIRRIAHGRAILENFRLAEREAIQQRIAEKEAEELRLKLERIEQEKQQQRKRELEKLVKEEENEISRKYDQLVRGYFPITRWYCTYVGPIGFIPILLVISIGLGLKSPFENIMAVIAILMMSSAFIFLLMVILTKLMENNKRYKQLIAQRDQEIAELIKQLE